MSAALRVHGVHQAERRMVRAPAEALLAQVYAEVSEAEERGPPLSAARAMADVGDIYAEMEDMHFSGQHSSAERRAKAIAGAAAYLRYIRDTCGGEDA